MAILDFNALVVFVKVILTVFNEKKVKIGRMLKRINAICEVLFYN